MLVEIIREPLVVAALAAVLGGVSTVLAQQGVRRWRGRTGGGSELPERKLALNSSLEQMRIIYRATTTLWLGTVALVCLVLVVMLLTAEDVPNQSPAVASEGPVADGEELR